MENTYINLHEAEKLIENTSWLTEDAKEVLCIKLEGLSNIEITRHESYKCRESYEQA